MNSNRSSNQSQGKAKGKNRPNKRKDAPSNPSQGPPKRQRTRGPKQDSVAAAYATGQAGKAAKVMQSKDSCFIAHREFLGNVTGSVAFTIANTYAVNPGLAASFPWLSGIAQNWEAYRFRKLRFCYYTRTGSNIPGSVIMAHDPDASDAAPVSEQIMTTYEAVQEDAPWKDICLPVRTSAMHDLGPRKFIRTSGLSANQDIKLYDSGNLYVGTVDGTAVSWGKLWIEYEVDLFTPQLPPAGAVAGVGTISNSAGTGAVTALLYGTTPTIAGTLISGVAANVVSFQNLIVGAEYQFSYAATVGTSSTTVAFGTLVGLTLQNTVTGATTNPGTISTFVATAQVGSLTVSSTIVGALTKILSTMVQIPNGSV